MILYIVLFLTSFSFVRRLIGGIWYSTRPNPDHEEIGSEHWYPISREMYWNLLHKTNLVSFHETLCRPALGLEFKHWTDPGSYENRTGTNLFEFYGKENKILEKEANRDLVRRETIKNAKQFSTVS